MTKKYIYIIIKWSFFHTFLLSNCWPKATYLQWLNLHITAYCEIYLVIIIQAMKLNFFDFDTFDPEEYEHYEVNLVLVFFNMGALQISNFYVSSVTNSFTCFTWSFDLYLIKKEHENINHFLFSFDSTNIHTWEDVVWWYINVFLVNIILIEEHKSSLSLRSWKVWKKRVKFVCFLFLLLQRVENGDFNWIIPGLIFFFNLWYFNFYHAHVSGMLNKKCTMVNKV